MRPLTVKETAEKLGLSVATIYQLCAARKLRHERHGLGRGTIKILEDAIEEYRNSVTIDAVRPQTNRKYRHLS
jgi:excisionase family DNA binding protein